jgi:hypothetical protein
MLAWTSDEATARDKFVAALVQQGMCWSIVGEEGLARVPAPRFPDRQVHLVWSKREDAEKWADVLVKTPRLRKISASEMLTEMLPKLADMRRLIGPDWNSDPVEPAMEPREFDRHIRRAMITDFIAAAHRHGQVFVLRNQDGPACLPSRLNATREMLPAFADRKLAEDIGKAVLPSAVPVRVSLADFTQRVLMWCAETKRTVAPGFMAGPGVIELQAWDVKTALAGGTIVMGEGTEAGTAKVTKAG